MDGHATFDFSGRVILIIGGGVGIGAGMGKAFYAAGGTVVVTGRRAQPLEAFCTAHPGRSSFVQMDVSIDADRRRTIDEVIARHGRLDVLINNALSYFGGPFEAQTLEQFEALYNVLLLAPTALIQTALPHLVKTRGSVINTSSTAGKYIPFPAWFMSVYSAAKAGNSHLTRALASELGPQGVRLNAIAPGLTRSENNNPDEATEKMFAEVTPMQRMGEAEDVAKLALFLASDAASWVTGQVVDASGGWGVSG